MEICTASDYDKWELGSACDDGDCENCIYLEEEDIDGEDTMQ